MKRRRHSSAARSRRSNLRRNGLRRLFAALVLIAVLTIFLLHRDGVRDFLVDDTRFSEEIVRAARTNGLDPALVRAVVFQESRFNPSARGTKGEIGLMQILPDGAAEEWARTYRRPRPTDAELRDPELNLAIGCWYLARAMRRWQDRRCQIELALCQYNAGARRAERWQPDTPDGTVIDRITIASTRLYVERIMARYRKYKEES